MQWTLHFSHTHTHPTPPGIHTPTPPHTHTQLLPRDQFAVSSSFSHKRCTEVFVWHITLSGHFFLDTSEHAWQRSQSSHLLPWSSPAPYHLMFLKHCGTVHIVTNLDCSLTRNFCTSLHSSNCAQFHENINRQVFARGPVLYNAQVLRLYTPSIPPLSTDPLTCTHMHTKLLTKSDRKKNAVSYSYFSILILSMYFRPEVLFEITLSTFSWNELPKGHIFPLLSWSWLTLWIHISSVKLRVSCHHR